MKIKKYVFISVGILSTSLGIAGIVIPLLPTTPFLLLATFLFLNSSERLYNWLINHKFFGRYIHCYLKHRAITLKLKIISFITLWATLLLSAVLMKSVYITLLLVIVGIGVSIHLLLLKTLGKDEITGYDEPQ